jgi:hypothetical protein
VTAVVVGVISDNQQNDQNEQMFTFFFFFLKVTQSFITLVTSPAHYPKKDDEVADLHKLVSQVLVEEIQRWLEFPQSNVVYLTMNTTKDMKYQVIEHNGFENPIDKRLMPAYIHTRHTII